MCLPFFIFYHLTYFLSCFYVFVKSLTTKGSLLLKKVKFHTIFQEKVVLNDYYIESS